MRFNSSCFRGFIVFIAMGWCGFAPAAVSAPPAVPVFGTASRVAELSVGGGIADFPNSISADGLRIVFQSNRKGRLFELYSAKRASLSSPFVVDQNDFSIVNELASNISAGVISANDLELFYQKDRNIYRATRVDPSLPFSNPVQLTGIQVGTGIHSPQFLSSDGLRLYHFNTSSGNSLTTGLYVASRASINSSFGASSNAPFSNVPYAEEMYLSPDELQLFYANANGQAVWAWRPDLTTPFSPAERITTLDPNGIVGADLFTGTEIFFNYGDDIYTAKLVPEPSAAALSCLGGWMIFCRRSRRGAR